MSYELSNRCFGEIDNPKTVLYVMMNAFRLNHNMAIHEGMKLQKMGCSFKIVMWHIVEENEVQNSFWKEGVKNYKEIQSFDISLIDDMDELVQMVQEYDVVFIDQPYLKEEFDVVDKLDKDLIYVEHNVAVPVRCASQKEEYSARTIRPKIWKLVDEYRIEYPVLTEMFLFEEVANEVLNHFINEKLSNYEHKNDPSVDYRSHLSVFLKYGFISPTQVLEDIDLTMKNAEVFLEELIIRRELAYNFVYYNKNYDDFNFMTYDWAYHTMDEHRDDQREYIYSMDDYLRFNTHDEYFNTCMKEMVHTGDMHGYMRMYWAKKILEWSSSYEEAYQILITLNNYYFIDGNTPNGYTNVAWIFGKHDRAWKERSVFGKLRYMNENGLRRKFDIESYVNRVNKEVG